MQSLPFVKRQVLILIVFSFLLSVAAIIHGIFFDADFEQIKRLTLQGFVLTLLVIIPILLFLEWVFDINNKQKFDELEARIEKLEGKLKAKVKRKR